MIATTSALSNDTFFFGTTFKPNEAIRAGTRIGARIPLLPAYVVSLMQHIVVVKLRCLMVNNLDKLCLQLGSCQVVIPWKNFLIYALTSLQIDRVRGQTVRHQDRLWKDAKHHTKGQPVQCLGSVLD